MRIYLIRFFFSFILFITSSTAFCQVSNFHYIYIQSEQREPFYIMINGVNYSSTANGHIILSKLPAISVPITVGFAKKKYPEQHFTIPGTDDYGFTLKNTSETSWVLENLQDFVTVKNGETYQPAENTSLVAATPTINQDIAQTKQSSDTITFGKTELPQITKQLITKIRESKSVEGLTQVYTDAFNAITDTIEVFIATEEIITPTISLVDDLPKACTLASVEDFLKTRMLMAAAANENDMLLTATTSFAAKCYSTEQVKNLGALFLTDAGRVQFFTAAKPAVYDTGNFALLQKQLTDAAALQQFKKLLQ